MITILVAMSENGVIGCKGKLPWRNPEDLKLFKKLTIGKIVIMGRKTWESLPKKPLPDRLNIVLTRQRSEGEWQETRRANGTIVPINTIWASNLLAALDLAGNDVEVFIIGGGQVYKEALPLADRILVSRIPGKYDGDVFFPSLEGWTGKLVEEYETFSTWEYKK
jgi:dihydrofolate reductase